jgi:hypothetical protein
MQKVIDYPLRKEDMQRFATLLIVFLPILAAVGCTDFQNAIYKSAIEKALHEDVLTGREPTYGHNAAMRKVDLGRCPRISGSRI